MKKFLILFLISIALLGCEKEGIDIVYLTINAEALDSNIKVEFGVDGVSVIDSVSRNGISYMTHYNPSLNFYFKASSTDSLVIIGHQGLDTLFIRRGFKEVVFNEIIK